MDQLDDKLSEIQLLLSQLSDVRLSGAESVGEDPNNVDGMLNALIDAQKNDQNNSQSPYTNSNQDIVDNSNIYNDINNSDVVDTPISSPTGSEYSDRESGDEMIEEHPEHRNPQLSNNDNNNNVNYRIPNQSHINNIKNKLFDKSSKKPPLSSNNNNKLPLPSNSNNNKNSHFDIVSVNARPNSRVHPDLDFISEPNNVDLTQDLEPYDSVSNTEGHLYSTTGETYVMSNDYHDYGVEEPDRTSLPPPTAEVIKESPINEQREASCCCAGCCCECILRTCSCLWFILSSILFILDIYSDLCLAVHYTFTSHQIWGSLTFIFFFLPWMYNVYSFYKFQRCKRSVWERWCGGLFLLVGLYPVFRNLVALLDNLYSRRHNNRKRRNSSDHENNSTSAAEIFMTTVLLQDIPQIFLQFFIVGWRNAIGGPAMISLITSFLCIVITLSSGFAAITEGQYEWMSDNVEMFLLQPCQEKIVQSRLLKDEWKDFYESSPSFDPLLIEVEKSKKKLKTKMETAKVINKPTSLSRRGKYYTSTFPVYVFMTISFVPSLSLFASLEETKIPWMALVVYFMVHLSVTWSLLCCRGAIYFPIHKLRRPLINYTGCKCSCRKCAMRFSFVLQMIFFLLVNAFLSVWCTSVAPFAAQRTNSSILQCLPSYIWPNTLPILKKFQVTLTNNSTSAEWFSCQGNYDSTQTEGSPVNIVLDWISTFRICMSDQVTIVYWVVTVSSALLLIYHLLLVCQPRVDIPLDQQTQLWRGIFDERKNLWDKIQEEQKKMKAWDRVKASKTIQRNEVWYTTVNKCVYSKWKKKPTPVILYEKD